MLRHCMPCVAVASHMVCQLTIINRLLRSGNRFSQCVSPSAGLWRKSPVTGEREQHFTPQQRLPRYAVSAAVTGVFLLCAFVVMICSLNLQVQFAYCPTPGAYACDLWHRAGPHVLGVL